MTLRSIILTIILNLLLSASAFSHKPRLIGFLQGDNSADQLGWHSDGLGDINGDGLGDFIVCQERNPEKMMIYLGGPHPFDSPPVLTILDYNNPKYVGDVDCDGFPDFLAVSPSGDTMRLYLGMESLDADDYLEFHVEDTVNYDYSNYRVTGGGDNNNDGRPDFWVSRHADRKDTIRGYFGCDLLDTIPDLLIIQNNDPDNRYASILRTFCSDCDLNGDSIPDIIYGQHTGSIEYPGRVCIVWGNENLSSAANLMFYAPGMGAIDDNMFGSDLACMGDISGDGVDDLWVRQGGRSYIYFGGRPFDTLVDLGLDYHWTDRVEMIGDINNDDWNDIMLVYTDNAYSQIAFMYCGPGMDTLVDKRFNEYEIGETVDTVPGSVAKVGVSFSWVGDVDGDSIDDILVGADVGGMANGWMFVLAGWDDPMTAITGDGSSPSPRHLKLSQNYPNPFNSGTIIEFTLPRSGYTELKVYNLLGEIVAIPLQQILSAGEHKVSWDGRDVDNNPTPTGVYFYRLTSGEFSEIRKMILLK